MKFGLILPTNLPQASREGIREAALLAEELGYDSIWTTDHIMMNRAAQVPYHTIFEALSTLAWLAGLTSRVKLGVSILVLTQRNPVLVAKEAATIDRLSGGRLVLGVGAGWHQAEFDYLNADFRRRGRIFDEGIRIMRHLWTTPEEPFHGEFHNFEDQRFGPPPVQPNGPPILVGGLSQSALERAVRYGDGWHASRIAPDQFEVSARELARLAPDRKLPLSLRMNISAQRGPQPDERGGRFVMGGSLTEIFDDVRRYEDAGCSFIAIQPWEGDRPAFVDLVRRFASEVIAKLLP
jgi:probable F420-dependent oxidoreductase